MRLPSPDFESGASANSATPARYRMCSISTVFLISKRSSAKGKEHFCTYLAATLKISNSALYGQPDRIREI